MNGFCISIWRGSNCLIWRNSERVYVHTKPASKDRSTPYVRVHMASTRSSHHVQLSWEQALNSLHPAAVPVCLLCSFTLRTYARTKLIFHSIQRLCTEMIEYYGLPVFQTMLKYLHHGPSYRFQCGFFRLHSICTVYVFVHPQNR